MVIHVDQQDPLSDVAEISRQIGRQRGLAHAALEVSDGDDRLLPLCPNPRAVVRRRPCLVNAPEIMLLPDESAANLIQLVFAGVQARFAIDQPLFELMQFDILARNLGFTSFERLTLLDDALMILLRLRFRLPGVSTRLVEIGTCLVALFP